MGKLTQDIVKFLEAYKSKGHKISSEQAAFQLGVYELPQEVKSLCGVDSISGDLAFEGSVGKGSWSRTPWVAIYDTRVTERASDGFYVALIFAESLDRVFLVLTNTSSSHINYKPYKIDAANVTALNSFSRGAIPKGLLSQSGRGSGPSFEQSTIQWREYAVGEMESLEKDLGSLVRCYKLLVDQHLQSLPREKPFKPNPFLLR
ncbi:MrcB family domain-containing protein [Bdellovibrio sp. GT3]|uniref:MrcB family domain-containing protein n=1 Tax=Bdellovibrio sp. GT3 TaxID=3136282 RepID=UPI0030F2F615